MKFLRLFRNKQTVAILMLTAAVAVSYLVPEIVLAMVIGLMVILGIGMIAILLSI